MLTADQPATPGEGWEGKEGAWGGTGSLKRRVGRGQSCLQGERSEGELGEEGGCRCSSFPSEGIGMLCRDGSTGRRRGVFEKYLGGKKVVRAGGRNIMERDKNNDFAA